MYEMTQSFRRMVTSLVNRYERPPLEKAASSSSGPVPLENTPQYQNKTVSYFEEFFTLDKKVVIRRLKSRPELNDTEGTVVLNNNKRVIKNDGIIRVVVKTVNGDTILIKPANLFYDTTHENPAQGIYEDGYELTDGSPIYNCLGEFVGMHNSVKNPATKRVFFSDDPGYREVFESVGIYLPQNC